MKKKIEIVIADDQPLYLKWLFHALSQQSSFEIVGKASNGLTALKIIEEKRPDIALIDYDMPGLNGFEISAFIKDKNLPVRLVILSVHNDPGMIEKAHEAGVSKYLLKDISEKEIIKELKNTLSNRSPKNG